MIDPRPHAEDAARETAIREKAPLGDAIHEEAAREEDRIAEAARRAAAGQRRLAEEPELSLGARLAQIGVLGWMIVLPALAGLVCGRWLDRHAGTRVFFSAPLLMLGAALGLYAAWKWMHRQTVGKRP